MVEEGKELDQLSRPMIPMVPEELKQVGTEVQLNQVLMGEQSEMTDQVELLPEELEIQVSDKNQEQDIGVRSLSKNKKKQTSRKSRLVTKSLQENEEDCNEKFAEKIIEEGDGYVCKDCEFSTAWRLSARSHALRCGTVKKTRKKGKQYICPQWDQVFGNKKLFNKHFKAHHMNTSYRCSQCGKHFRGKQNLMNHLRIHTLTMKSHFHALYASSEPKTSGILTGIKNRNTSSKKMMIM